MVKAPQLGRKDRTMVEAKVKAEHRVRVSVRARVVRKALASKRVRTAGFQLFQCITTG